MIEKMKSSVLVVFLGAVVWVIAVGVAMHYKAPKWAFELLILVLAFAFWHFFHDPGKRRRIKPPSN